MQVGEVEKDIEEKKKITADTQLLLNYNWVSRELSVPPKPCTATRVWKAERKGNHRLAKQRAVV